MKTRKQRIHRRIRLYVKKNERLCRLLNRSQKLYYFGILFFILATILYFIPSNQPFISFASLAVFFLISAVCSDVLTVYVSLWRTHLGKAIILIFYAATTNLAYALSSLLVNEAIEYGPVQLNYAVNFVALMLIPFFIIAFTILILSIFLVASQFYLFLILSIRERSISQCLKSKSIERYPRITFVSRIIVFPVVLGGCIGMGKSYFPKYMAFLESTTQSFIYYLEAQPYSRCVLNEGERAIYTSSDELVIVQQKSGGYHFEPRECVPVINSKN